MNKIPSKNYFKNLKQPIQYNEIGELLVLGCNYHTVWQKHRNMRFVLVEVENERCKLQTRTTLKSFWTNTKDLIFISSNSNINKANDYLGLKGKARIKGKPY